MILTVGDSFTFGEELPDRLQQAWPYLLGKEKQTTVHNLGESGSSNDGIFRKVIEQTTKIKFELVVIGWTSPVRFEVWSELINKPVTIMPDSKAGLPWTVDYYRYSHNDQFCYLRWFNQILVMQGYLKSICQPYLFINIDSTTTFFNKYKTNFEYIWQHYDIKNYIGWPHQGMIQLAGDCPLGPGGHPLALGHERIAHEITTYLRT